MTNDDDFYNPVIHTQRLDLIPLPVEFWAASFAGDREEAQRIMGLSISDEWFAEKSRLAMRLEQLRRDPGLQPWLSRAMTLRETGEMVGQIGFHTYPAPAYLEEIAPGGIEFGYAVFTPFRRRGFAREAARALMSWAGIEYGVPRFVLSISPDNIPSTRLAQSLGFMKVGSQEDEEDGPEDIYVLERMPVRGYPAGEETRMLTQDRREKIESYGGAYTRLMAALQEFPPEMWTYRPDDSDWTIHEILVHISDSEANSYVRCRRFIAEPGSDVMGYDGDRWARDLRYHEQSAADALELFRHLRRSSYMLIRALPEEVWSNTVVHSESGRMTFDEWLDIYERHIPEHIAQMRAIYHTWRLEREE